MPQERLWDRLLCPRTHAIPHATHMTPYPAAGREQDCALGGREGQEEVISASAFGGTLRAGVCTGINT